MAAKSGSKDGVIARLSAYMLRGSYVYLVLSDQSRTCVYMYMNHRTRVRLCWSSWDGRAVIE